MTLGLFESKTEPSNRRPVWLLPYSANEGSTVVGQTIGVRVVGVSDFHSRTILFDDSDGLSELLVDIAASGRSVTNPCIPMTVVKPVFGLGEQNA